jgi:hypothetical protein
VAADKTRVSAGRPLWRKAPVRLVRQPTLFAAFAAAALLVTVIVAAYPLFLAGTESQLLAAAIANPILTPYGMGISYRATNVPFSSPLTLERQDAFTKLAAANKTLGPVITSMAAPPVQITGLGGSFTSEGLNGRLFAGDNTLRHVHVLSGHEGNGIWLPDFIANGLHARPGDRIQLHEAGQVVTVPVDGTYVALNTLTSDGYWLGWSDEINPACAACPVPPSFLLTTPSRLRELQTALRDTRADQLWVAPVRTTPPLTLDEARSLAAYADRVHLQMEHGPILGPIFQCCGRTSITTFHNAADEVVTLVERRTAGVQGPVRLVMFAGLAISLVVIAVASGFSLVSRPLEVGMLTVRGWSPVRVGVKGALESVLPVVLGAAAGLVLAVALVSWVGTSARVGAVALRTAFVNASAGALTSIILVGIVVAVAFSSSGEHRGWFARAFLWFPWELLAFAAVVVLRRRLQTGGGVITSGGVERPAGSLVLFPLAAGLAVALVSARIASALLLRSARSRREDSVSACWLAVRRLATSLRVSAVFFVATALAVSVFVVGQAVVGSIRATLDTKAHLFVGSDVEVVTGTPNPIRFPLPITLVQRDLSAGWFDTNDQDRFDLVVIDPPTFVGAAYWNPRLSSTSIQELVSRLGGVGTATPVLLANAPTEAPTAITLGGSRIPVAVVGRASSFPGAASTRPIVVMSRAEIVRELHQQPETIPSTQSTTELWIRGPASTALAALGPAGIRAELIVTADQVMDLPLLVATINTFVVLDVLGLVALCLAIVLAVVYLQVRQRRRVLASTLSRRMEPDKGRSRRAMTLELGSQMLAALILGAVVGVLATPMILGALDPLPTIPPPPLSVRPWESIVGAAVLLAAATLAGAWLAERAARRVSLAEVMRVGS